MIRINLLNQVDASLSSEQPEISKNKKVAVNQSKPWLWKALAAMFILTAAGAWYAYTEYYDAPAKQTPMANVPQKSKPVVKPEKAVSPQVKAQVVAEAPKAKVEPKPRQVQVQNTANQAVETVVAMREPQPKVVKKYRKLLPSERIIYQQNLMQHTLGVIRKSSPVNMGFVDISVRLPGLYYLHGMAENKKVLQKFHSALNKASSVLKAPEGSTINTRAEEFTYYGQFKNIRSPKERMTMVSDVSAELQKFKKLAAKNGCSLKGFSNPEMTSFGGYKRLTYKVNTSAGYKALEDLFSAMQKEKSRMGILEMSMEAVGQEKMKTTLHLVMYVKS
jgi:hypothetical protein